MIRPPIIIRGDGQRDLLARIARELPLETVVSFREANRTLEQNAKLHAMIHDIARQEPMGWKKTPDTWKAILMHACNHEIRFELGLDGQPFPIGLKTSRLTVKQMAELIEFMYAFGANHGVEWSTPDIRREL